MFSLNASHARGTRLPEKEVAAFSPSAVDDVVALVRQHPSYAVTPLTKRSALAASLGVGDVLVKDEAHRFGLESFKALGGAYAVVKLAMAEAERCLGRPAHVNDLLDPNVRRRLRLLGVGCATDGNHGRSVAAGANLVGMSATIFVHSHVSNERIDAIAAYGANIVRVAGTYDDSVAFAQAECERRGWTLVSDVAIDGYEDVPRTVMQGYTVMVRELKTQLKHWPTHVFLQAGVGGFAAAVAATMMLDSEIPKPRFVIVEPRNAACLHASNAADACVSVKAEDSTLMAMLECYKPSSIAWRVLSRLANAYVVIDDDDAVKAMKLLAAAGEEEAPMVAGESGAAGAAGLVAICQDASARAELDLDAESRVLLFNTEGATAPSIYRKLMAQDSPASASSTVAA